MEGEQWNCRPELGLSGLRVFEEAGDDQKASLLRGASRKYEERKCLVLLDRKTRSYLWFEEDGEHVQRRQCNPVARDVVLVNYENPKLHR